MTTYSIFARRPDEAPAAVPEKFSWFAALLPPLHALVHASWLALLVWALGLVVVTAAAQFLGGETGFWLYVVLAAFLGFEAASLRRWALSRRGWRHVAEIVAPAADIAEVEWLKRRRT